jgi:hypothetical protein
MVKSSPYSVVDPFAARTGAFLNPEKCAPLWPHRGKRTPKPLDDESLARAIEAGVEAGVRHATEQVVRGELQMTVEEAIRKELQNSIQALAVEVVRVWNEERFNRLATQWKKETFLLSKVSAKVIHMAYQKIIGMGAAAVPLILKDLLKNGPNHWFWALHAITEEDPVPKDKVGDITAMTEAWLQWGRNKGYLKDFQVNTQEGSQT